MKKKKKEEKLETRGLSHIQINTDVWLQLNLIIFRFPKMKKKMKKKEKKES